MSPEYCGAMDVARVLPLVDRQDGGPNHRSYPDHFGQRFLAAIPTGTTVTALGSTYRVGTRTVLQAGPPARAMGEDWRAAGGVVLAAVRDLAIPLPSTDTIEVSGIWTGEAILVDRCAAARFVPGPPVGPQISPETRQAIIASQPIQPGAVLGGLSDCEDTRFEVCVPLLTPFWRTWADNWQDRAFVQVAGFVTPVGTPRLYPER